MSIEEKAKAYDEALERARKYMTKGYDILMPEIFPELKESEDERIRKEIINYLNFAESHNLLRAADYEKKKEWLIYLEKQKYDRMKPIYDARESFESALEKAWKDYNDSGARTVDGCEDDYVECAHAKGFREGYLFGLEKQKEQSLRDFIDDFPYSDQKEPKFKIGDKLVSTNNSHLTYEILDVGHVNELGNIEYKVEIFTDDKSDNPSNVKYMECRKVDEWGKLIERKSIEDVIKNITKDKEAAIKFLKSAGIMDDNGELAKMYRSEQKPAEWNEEDVLNLDRIVGSLNSLKQYVRENTAMSQEYKEAVFKRIEQEYSFLKSLPERFNLQPKQEWSEEDKNILADTIFKLAGFMGNEKNIDFLKSLRPSWKPSEHQMTILKAVKEYVGRGSGYWGEGLGSLIEDLEKL